MANDIATVWGGQIKLGRDPANNELLLGDTNGNFVLTPSSSIIPTVDIQALLNSISSTQGAILYRNATSWVALNPGTAGYVLSTGGAGANPSWVAQTTPYTPVWTERVKTTADQTVTNSSSPVNATDMVFAASAGVFYSFEFGLLFSTVASGLGTSAGAQVRFSFPNGTIIFGPGNSQTGSGNLDASGLSGIVQVVAPSAAGTTYYALNLLGTFSCTAPGNVQLQFSEVTARASTSTTLLKGSWFRYRTV